MTSPGYEARNWVRQAVTGLTGGAGTLAARDPLAVLEALVSLRAAVTQAERDAARRAREDGRSWHEVGEALGFADDPQPGMTSVAEHAFARFASDLGGGPSFTWECPSCGNLVSDHGPEQGGPHDAERGHGDGCERFAATVAAWDLLWGEDSEEGD